MNNISQLISLLGGTGAVAKKLKIDLTVRPQNLSKEKYLDICKLYENLS